MVKESTSAGRVLVLTFIDLVDMFEQIMAASYDYGYIREKFAATGVLNDIADILLGVADEVDNIAYMVLANTTTKHKVDFITELEQLKSRIDRLASTGHGSNIALKKILVNLRDLNGRVKNIHKYYNSRSDALPETNITDDEYAKFVSHQDYAPNVFFDNLTFGSTAFKHALRVSLVCLFGFVIAKNFAIGHHSYWVLLTIIVILKPGFSLSKQRNYQRLTGTIAGGLIGIAILLFIPERDVQFTLLVVLMIGAYSFLRLNYVVSVIFMTPYVLILFKFLGVGFVVEERIVDTIIGSAIAFMASYALFPTWESARVQENLAGVIYANLNYLVKIAQSLGGKPVNVIEYKLARKDVFVKSANLSAAFERMTSEPKSKQKNIKEVHKFVVLNHILSSYLATIGSGMAAKTFKKAPAEDLKLLKRSIAVLSDCCKKLGRKPIGFQTAETLPAPVTGQTTLSADDILLKEQLDFIYKIGTDIARVTEGIVTG
jgi:uncharacterized membrane protein YccC